VIWIPIKAFNSSLHVALIVQKTVRVDNVAGHTAVTVADILPLELALESEVVTVVVISVVVSRN